jgi:hypothetical protein
MLFPSGDWHIPHSISSTGKPWPYQGLNQDGMRFIRELGIAAAKAREGRPYESLNIQDWREIPVPMEEYICHAETSRHCMHANFPSVRTCLRTGWKIFS